MLGRQPVRVTYAHKRRRVQNASTKLLSSPLEVLPPEVDNLTRAQMVRRMLKRSRRVALAEQLEDKNVEHIREHLAKRMKRTHDRLSSVEPGAPLDMSVQDRIMFQTPFPSPQSARESSGAKSLVPEQLSPVPVTKRVISRTSSRNLKENAPHSQTLASPFSSRPASAASSPKHNGQKRASRRVPRSSHHVKSRTLSGVFRGNVRRVSRKDSTTSLKDLNRELSAKHQRYPSSPSISYMRPRFAKEDWFVPPRAFSRAFDYDEIPSPGGSAHSDASFYADLPQSCSTPAKSKVRRLSDLHGRKTGINNPMVSSSSRRDPAEDSVPDVEMIVRTVPPRRRTIHLCGDSIFSSSDEFTIGTLPNMKSGTIVERSNATDWDEVPVGVAGQVLTDHGVVYESSAGRSLAGSFVAEYEFLLGDPPCSPASTAATKMLGLEGVPKLSVGDDSFGLPGTSPAHGGNLFIRTARTPATSILPAPPPMARKLFVNEGLIDLPGTSPAHGGNLLIRTARSPATSVTLASSPKTITCPPPSPASDLALEFGSMDVHGEPHLDGEAQRPSASVPLHVHSRSVQVASGLAESTTKKALARRPARNRAGTIRASDFTKPGTSTSGVVGAPIPAPSNVRRTRSGTVVGPDSKLATKGGSAALAAVQSGSESESDDELLLKTAWIEDLEYLGVPVPRGEDAESDELNLGRSRYDLESGPRRRLGLRKR